MYEKEIVDMDCNSACAYPGCNQASVNKFQICIRRYIYVLFR